MPPPPPLSETKATRQRWTGMSLADRKTERRRLLLRAGFELLGGEGWSATTVRSVIERAGLNPRYFYESFSDLDDFVVAVYDEVVGALRDIVVDALGDAVPDPEAQLRAVVRATVEFVDEDRRRGRILYIEGIGNEALNLRRIEAGHGVSTFIEQYAEEHGTRAPADHIGRVSTAIVVGGFSQLLIDWLDGRLPVAKDALIDEAAELFLALGDAAGKIAARRSTPAVSRPRRRLRARARHGGG